MSVAVGTAQAVVTGGSGPVTACSTKNTPTGPNTPPSVATAGIDALLRLESAPPGKKLSETSLAAIPKNRTMNRSLTMKWKLKVSGSSTA